MRYLYHCHDNDEWLQVTTHSAKIGDGRMLQVMFTPLDRELEAISAERLQQNPEMSVMMSKLLKILKEARGFEGTGKVSATPIDKAEYLKHSILTTHDEFHQAAREAMELAGLVDVSSLGDPDETAIVRDFYVSKLGIRH